MRGLGRKLRGLLRGAEAEAELDEELRFHIELETEAGIERGLDPKEARRQALVKFGGVERHREEARDVRRPGWWDAVRQDVRFSIRMLASSPVFSVAAILTLALGIGANTAIFSVVDAVLLSESPFSEPDRLVMLWETDRDSDTHHEPSSWPDVEDFRERSRTLSAVGSVVAQDFTLAGDGDPVRVAGLAVTPNLFGLLGVQPLVGRDFGADEGAFGSGQVVALGEEFWRSGFDADPGVVGQTITLNEQPATVVGVIPAEADLGIRQVHERADYAVGFNGSDVQVWAAFQPTADQYPRSTHPFLTLARLAPGVSLATAQAELADISADLEAEYPVNNARGVNLESYGDVIFGPVRPALWVLLGAVALVLLVTCANVANLLLARTTARSREVAVRSALGAPVSRIRNQFLVESGVLTALGASAGVGLAYLGLKALIAMAPAGIPRLGEATVNGAVLGYTAGIAVLVTMAFGMLPALHARRLDLQETLKVQSGRRGSEGKGGRRFRSGLVVAEVALAVSLVVGAGLLLRSFWQLQEVDPGFDTEQVLKAQYQLPGTRYPLDFSRWPNEPEITGFHARFLESIRSIPGVEAAAIAGGHPLDPGFTNSFVIVGREAESADFPEIRTRFISPGYLETAGVALLEGRDIRESDDVNAPNVALINRTAAERYFPGGTAIGQEIGFWGANRRIVGIIGDEKFKGLDAPTDPAAYVPLGQNPQQTASLLARSDGDPTALVPEFRRRFAALDPQLALYGVEPLSVTLAESIGRPRFIAVLLSIFAGLAIALALIGVHGVMSYTVAQRRSEVGIRMALGASRGTVMRSVVGEGMTLAGLGLALGLVGALAGSRLLGSLVFGVSTADPATFIAVAVLVLATATAAATVPAWKAARADPAGALRVE